MTTKCSNQKADEALQEAEASLEAAGVSLSLNDPNVLVNPELLLPEPESLKDPDKQKLFETAIEKFNIALEELDREFGDDSSCSVSDRALLHFHLGLVYLFDAMSRLLISDEGSQTFIFERSSNSEELYTFDVAPDTRAKLNAAKEPEDYVLAFTTSERQGLMDFFDLLDDAIVKPIDPNIQPQSSSVNRPPYSKYAMWHLQKSVLFFEDYDPEIQKSIEDFNNLLNALRAIVQEKCVSWGFTYTLPPGR